MALSRLLASRSLISSLGKVAVASSSGRLFASAAEKGGSSVMPWLFGAAAAGGGLWAAKEYGLLNLKEGSGSNLPAAAKRAFEPSPKDYAAVKNAINDLLDKEGYDDGSYGPILVRLAWHCAGTYDKVSGTGGSDGATMRFSPESNHGGNAGLGIARDLLEPVKAKFPWITYSDLYTLGGATAIEAMGGPVVAWRPGRKDKEDGTHCTPDGRLPDGSQGAAHIRDVFYRMGFNDQEIVALSGAHCLGRCHTDRSGFLGPWTNAPTTFSNLYFDELKNNKWRKKKWEGPVQYEDKSGQLMMLPTDMALLWDKKFRPYVDKYAADSDAFFDDFASAFSRLLELGCANLKDIKLDQPAS